MKVAFAENNVKGSAGLQQTSGFSINTTAHAFRLLSSGMYSDKVRAVLREIGCNAVDAHIAADCVERPIRVKLPGSLDDQFYIQDWGIGLSHEDVMGLYTTYFASSKQNSNDFTGAFGLGSKSPFSYTDSFNVVSAYGGKKRTYSLYIGNEGAPKVSLMAEEETEKGWPTGVRVGFAVKPGDYLEFQEKAQDVFQWFKVTPEIKGSRPITPVKYTYECGDFRLVSGGEVGKVTALMGNVAYPVALSSLNVQKPDTKNAKDLLNFVGIAEGLVVPLTIGDVQVAASRESLQYDPTSVKVLQEKMRLAMRRMGNDVVKVLEDAEKGGWKELCLAAQKLETVVKDAGIKYYFSSFATGLGIDPKRIKELAKYVERTEVDVPESAGKLAALKLVKNGVRGAVSVFSVSKGLTSFGNDATLKIHPDTVIAVGLAPHAPLRAKRAIAEGVYSQILVLTKSKLRPATQADLDVESAELSANLGNMPIIDVTTLPMPDVLPRPPSARKKKGWVPTLPTGVTFNTYGLIGNSTQKELGNIDPYFVCRIEKSTWGRTRNHMRVFQTTKDDDVVMDYDKWERIWAAYATVQNKIKLPNAISSYAVLNAAEIKQLALPRIGWTNAIDKVKEYAERTDVRAALVSKIRKKKFTAASGWHHVHSDSWMSGLALKIMEHTPTLGIKHVLQDAKVWDQLQEMVAETRRNAGDPVVPKEVLAHQQLLNLFNLEDTMAGAMVDALTVDDLDLAFCKRFPLAKMVDFNRFKAFIDAEPTDAELMLKHILSKEA